MEQMEEVPSASTAFRPHEDVIFVIAHILRNEGELVLGVFYAGFISERRRCRV